MEAAWLGGLFKSGACVDSTPSGVDGADTSSKCPARTRAEEGVASDERARAISGVGGVGRDVSEREGERRARHGPRPSARPRGAELGHRDRNGHGRGREAELGQRGEAGQRAEFEEGRENPFPFF